MRIITRAEKVSFILIAALLVGAAVVGCAVGDRSQSPVSYSDGDARRTFAEPLPRVSTATLSALDRMGIKVEAQEKTDKRQVIKAKTEDLSVEVQLDAISPTSTRMQAVARNGLLSKDTATATEIVMQTERAINGNWALWR